MAGEIELWTRVIEATGAAIEFDGDWPALVERLGLTGMAGMVARHGELASFENGHFQLVVPESYRMYTEKAYQDKLKAELVARFGAGVPLDHVSHEPYDGYYGPTPQAQRSAPLTTKPGRRAGLRNVLPAVGPMLD